jgi:hypothetical protein
MKASHKRMGVLAVSALALLIAVLIALPTRKAEAVGDLEFDWDCDQLAQCTFTRVLNNHATYQYNFGDGNFSGLTTSTTVYHTYSIPNGTSNFTVYFMGYATSSGGSPDNIIGCTVTVDYSPGVGGHPGTHGTCT